MWQYFATFEQMNLTVTQTKRLLIAFLAVCCFLCVTIRAEDAKPQLQTIASLKAELETARAEISLLKAQQAWCQSELSIWAQNPDIVQIRLTLQRESAKAAEIEQAKSAKRPMPNPPLVALPTSTPATQ